MKFNDKLSIKLSIIIKYSTHFIFASLWNKTIHHSKLSLAVFCNVKFIISPSAKYKTVEDGFKVFVIF